MLRAITKNCHPERARSVSRRTCGCLLFCHPERSFLRSKKRSRSTCCSLAVALLLAPLSLCSHAQSSQPTHTFHDRATRLSFDYPANWTFAEHDHEISTFHLDARTAPRTARLRAVVAMPENPYPASTFSGAYLYFSVTPQTTPAACARQAVPPRLTAAETAHRAAEFRASHPDLSQNPDSDPSGPSGTNPAIPLITLPYTPDKLQIAGIPFTHGRDEQRDVCLTQHDDVYTTFRAGSCLRFDLAINNFCGGEVSGVRDISSKQLDDVRTILASILSTLRFDPK